MPMKLVRMPDTTIPVHTKGGTSKITAVKNMEMKNTLLKRIMEVMNLASMVVMVVMVAVTVVTVVTAGALIWEVMMAECWNLCLGSLIFSDSR